MYLDQIECIFYIILLRKCLLHSLYFTTLAGDPTAIAFAGISLLTNEFAPIIA